VYKASVILTTYNRNDECIYCLDRLLHLYDLEIILMDEWHIENPSLSDYCTWKNIKYVWSGSQKSGKVTWRVPGYAFNIGVKLCSEDYVIIGGAEIYHKDPVTDNTAIEQFSIAYGHFAGSGSLDTTGNLNDDTPSRAIYKQYAQLLLPPNDKKFTFNGTDSDYIYVVNFNRARIREKIDPGNIEFTFIKTPSATTTAATAGTPTKIIDDSSLNANSIGEAGLVYNLVSGSISPTTTIHNPSSPTYFGLLYPQHGIAIFNGVALDTGAQPNFSTDNSAAQNYNHLRLLSSLKGSGGQIQARSSEQVKSSYFFCRLKNAEYNYSNNPSFVTGSLGQLAFNTFIQDPQVYITTVGLYNDRKELLAVAKLSQPLLKSFTREALIKIKLDF